MQVEEEMHQATVTIPSQDEMTLLGTLARANGEDLLHAIGDSVVPYPKPAVFISGGLDSTILLHHLQGKTDEEIFTYSTGCPEENEFIYATKVAEHYGTIHKNVEIHDILPTFAELQKHLDRPRFNLWPYWCYEAALEDGRKTVYIGEGMDEHFGGYWYKPETSYQEYWAGVLEWSIPTHTQLAHLFNIKLQIPFLRLDVRQTMPYWDGEHRDKTHLRNLYKNIIPDFVVERKKNPGRLNFCKIWDREIAPHIPVSKPETRLESYKIINKWVIEKWLESH